MFKLLCKQGRARRGEITVNHGVVQTPVFMNVATQAAIKGALSSQDLTDVGCLVALSNAYHLHIRPGDELIRSLGGLHRFMAWSGPVLTDSGGFQIFSLAGRRKITEEGVAFQSHVDGRKIFMSPEDSVRIQSNLGSDIAMALDECMKIPTPRDYAQHSCDRTLRWLLRCKEELERQNRAPNVVNPGQMLFGINQGALFEDIRVAHMKQIAELDLPGYAIGGLAVGETTRQMYNMIGIVEEHMPEDRPRYLMGVGTPQNIVEAVALGIDFFDCVMPARNGRHGHLYTWNGRINLNNEVHSCDNAPIDGNCCCPVCQTYSRAYIRHLFRAGEMLAKRLAVLHNLFFYNTLMERIRDAIEKNEFDALRRQVNSFS
ncbi:MAG: tRNA guanosine(34) transglycosylase Tgt [Oscillospiraceae bacterium]|nr:tRNA guanosine(34) transglycosylase Tgt [Oscillospiraceae bacterium]MCL2153336.1 tRNA guanosine(34) transglycosylase Tgt [Oscillospiraceae bacterium]